MPANLVEINGNLRYEIGDSKMPPLIKWLETYSYGEIMDPERKDDTVFAEMVKLMAKSVYGEDFEFKRCVIELDVEEVGIVRFEAEVTGNAK
jgi:hypothetical protein